MTLVAAWIQTKNKSQHLVLSADSRLTGGMTWDSCPKIFPLERGDSALCFAGDTYYAYPILLQVQMMISMHDKVSSRAMDICELQPCITDIMNSMLGYRSDFNTAGEDIPDVKFLFAGYSWRLGEFKAWIHKYDVETKSFKRHRVTKFHNGQWPFAFIGDYEREAKTQLLQTLNKSHVKGTSYNIDMEPFDVLNEYIQNKDVREIGGPPQLVKIYKHMNYIPFNVQWPDGQGAKTFLGRPLLDYEKNKFLNIDAKTQKVTDPWGDTINQKKKN